MTTIEFSNEFDVLVDSYRRFKSYDNQQILDSIEFSEYEKSLYLTRAQEEIIKSLYSGNYDSFENSEELRKSLSSLIKTKDYTEITIDNIYALPEDYWYLIYEEASIKNDLNNCNDKTLSVHPVTHDELYKVQQNPFRGANNRRILRVDIGKDTVQLISKYPILNYHIRYISKPSPIILCDLTNDDVSIDGINVITECLLPDIIHNDILKRAVQNALVFKLYQNTNKNNQ